MASSGTPSPSESVGDDGVTQAALKAVGAVWVVPIGPKVLDRVRALSAASTSSRVVAPMSAVRPSPGPSVPVLRVSPQAAKAKAVRAVTARGARIQNAVMRL